MSKATTRRSTKSPTPSNREAFVAAAKASKKTQLERFKEAAREVRTDNDKARFEAILGKIAAPKPPTKPVKKGK